MRRLVSALLCAAVLAVAAPASAHHGYCYYDPDTMVGFGCSEVDYQMIEAKTHMQLAENTGDRGEFWDAAYAAYALDRAYGGERLVPAGDDAPVLHVRPFTPLSHYQVLDSAEAGTNIRYATVPGPGGRPQLIFWDRQGRPMKVAGMNYTSRAERWVDIALSWAWGAVGGGGWVTGSLTKAVTFGGVVVPAGAAAAGDGLISLGLSLGVNIPDAESTQVLVDVLHTQDDGTQVVYRNRVVISREGRIDVKENDGKTWWRLDGVVRYDRDGNPVW